MRSPALLLLAGAAALLGVAYSGQAFGSTVDAGVDSGIDPSIDPTQGADSSSADTSGFNLGAYLGGGQLDASTSNLAAFLDMISISEGTYGRGDNGYNWLVGGGTFSSYAQHPRIVVSTRYGYSDAAGRYQIMAAVPGKITTNTWDWVSRALGLTDFSPASQDAAAKELIRRRGALDDVYAGNIASAISKCKPEWASLPGAGYGQHENAMSTLLAAYQSAGGVLA